MKLGVVSDTHDNLDLVEAAVSHFERENVDVVVHCGDIVAPFSATPFDADFDFHAVRGNNDGEWKLREVVESFGTYHDDVAQLTFDETDIAVYHGTEVTLVDALVESGTYDYVFRGHTHQRTYEQRNGTVHVNPGGLPIPGADESFHVAVLDLDTGTISFEAL
ncbi:MULTISPECIES: metallophosphoesterase [Haloferax]|uniref:Phosphoesterase n=1 Tax=Haloferax marinum TaxID=2666143 RepID=A0A6A8G6S8_9EURY|nr:MULTISPECIES: metallophosphoesterase [Haloferax]KAB1197288.1 metallophosphoesterase family protein [Haloferax sp. CBA1150]MRW96328.1 YfcE family phosphodiesterase [Haloferax marinum]